MEKIHDPAARPPGRSGLPGDKGYFRAEGLDYEFRGGLSAERKKQVDAGGAVIEVPLRRLRVLPPGRRQQGRQIRPSHARATGP